MPVYEYKCGDCGLITAQNRSVSNRNMDADCRCGGVATKIISRPNISMLHWAYDSNPIGTSMLDTLETQRRDDREYERMHNNPTRMQEGQSSMEDTVSGVLGGAL